MDLLGRTDNAVDTIVTLMREISQLVAPDDGISFDSATFTGEAIRENGDYAGVRREAADPRPTPYVEYAHEGYFDLWLLTRQPELNKEVLGTAIKSTFANRRMEIDTTPIGLSPAFGDDPTK